MSHRMKFQVGFVLMISMGWACAKDSEDASSQTTMTTEPTTLAAAPAPYDLQFLDTMSKHHQGAVNMAAAAQGKISNRELKALVLAKAQHPEVKALAQRIIDAQTKEIEAMKRWKASLTRQRAA